MLAASSGGHVNPAVTWALFLDRRISVVRLVLYIVAQFVGGFAGAGACLVSQCFHLVDHENVVKNNIDKPKRVNMITDGK